jgi:hypothetical protein
MEADDLIAARIAKLQLDSILYSLVAKADGPEWPHDRAKKAVEWYRRFLFLVARYPNEAIVPTKDIDEVWHTHILDTRKYAADCQEVFGDFLHHFPYLGSRGVADAELLSDTFLRTLSLFELHFNEIPISIQNRSSSSVCSNCSSGCSSHCGGRAVPRAGLDLETRPTLQVS